MRFWHLDIRTPLRRAFARAFPERQIFLRSEGEVRFIRLPAHVQVVAAGAVAVLLGWGLYASIRVLTGDERLAAREAELAFTTSQLDTLVREVTRLQRDALARTRRLEAQQAVLKNAIGVEAPAASPLDADDANGADTDDGGRVGSAAPAADREPADARASDDRGEERTSLLTHLPDAIERIRARTDRLVARLDRLAGAQRRLASAVLTRERARIEEARRLFARLDVSPAAMRNTTTQATDDGPSSTGVGGPFAPIARTASPLLSAGTAEEMPSDAPDLAADILRAGFVESVDRPFAPELRELARTLTVKQRITALLESLPRVRPAENYYISSHFGPRRDPFRKRRSMHSGLDMAGWRGEPIRAVAPGVVVKAGRASAYGLMVEIDHGNGYRTRYGHMRRLHVRAGQRVEAGTRIGDMGSTGRSTSTHLHWEVWYHERPVDPLPYLKAMADVETLRRKFEGGKDGQG